MILVTLLNINKSKLILIITANKNQCQLLVRVSVNHYVWDIYIYIYIYMCLRNNIKPTGYVTLACPSLGTHPFARIAWGEGAGTQTKPALESQCFSHHNIYQ